jgi:DNA mismatch repair ATPase MutS
LLIQRLQRVCDVQRIVQKFTMNKGDADDLISLAKTIRETADVRSTLETARNSPSTQQSRNALVLEQLLQMFQLDGPLELAQEIFRCIDEGGLAELHRQEENESAEVAASAVEAVQAVTSDGAEMLTKTTRVKARLAENRFSDADMQEAWIMRRTASETIARLHDDLDALQEDKNMLERELQQELGTNSLTLKWTPSYGHFVHLTTTAAVNKARVQVKDRLVASTRSSRHFYATEWSILGRKMDQTRLYIRAEETRIFNDLKQHVVQNIVALRRNATVLDELDVASAFATLASEEGWTRPKITSGTSHNITGGRHPTVKLGLEEQGRTFVSNDLNLNAQEQIWLVTGPNMAGKSTFLRQNALITILAQVGSYVPAQYAEIGLVDQIFSRVGAADDLFRDQSTFMVEMLETAAILKQATKRSFVIMDEVGRGTTPQDGMAVAYGALHHLKSINLCRTLFATHFHTLADLTADWPNLGRWCTDIKEDASGSFTFQHKLRRGVNRQSHALKVAKLAGLPSAALAAAESVIHQLHMEKEDIHTLPEEPQPQAIAATG